MAQQEPSTAGETNANVSNDDRSTPQLVRDIAGDTSTLVRKEIELARHEIIEALVARAKAAGALGAGAVMGLYMLLFLAVAGGLALATAMPAWAAFLIVAGVFAILAIAAVLFAKFRMQKPPMAPEETVRTVKEDVEWAKTQLRR
jgi:MFS family permease